MKIRVPAWAPSIPPSSNWRPNARGLDTQKSFVSRFEWGCFEFATRVNWKWQLCDSPTITPPLTSWPRRQRYDSKISKIPTPIAQRLATLLLVVSVTVEWWDVPMVFLAPFFVDLVAADWETSLLSNSGDSVRGPRTSLSSSSPISWSELMHSLLSTSE